MTWHIGLWSLPCWSNKVSTESFSHHQGKKMPWWWLKHAVESFSHHQGKKVPWWWLEHSVETSAKLFPILSWYQRTLFSVYAGADWEATTSNITTLWITNKVQIFIQKIKGLGPWWLLIASCSTSQKAKPKTQGHLANLVSLLFWCHYPASVPSHL